LLPDLQKLPLSYFHGGEAGTFRGAQKSFAEKFSVGSVNQRVRGENFLETRERLSRSCEQAAALRPDALPLQIALQLVNRAMREPFRFGFDERDKSTAFAERQFFGGVIRLPETVAKRFDELHVFPHKNARRAFVQAHRNHGGPPGMRSKADRG